MSATHELSEGVLRELLNSDFKLWDRAYTQEEGTSVTKTLILPHDIGEFTINFEGMVNAEARRSAVGAFGDAVREAVKDQISDEAVTARAAQAAARRKQVHGPRIESVGGTPLISGYTEADTQPIQSYDEVERERSDNVRRVVSSSPAGQLESLDADILYTQKRLAALELERRALAAYIEVMDASENENTQNQGLDEPLQDEPRFAPE